MVEYIELPPNNDWVDADKWLPPEGIYVEVKNGDDVDVVNVIKSVLCVVMVVLCIIKICTANLLSKLRSKIMDKKCECQDSEGKICGKIMTEGEIEQDGMCSSCADNVWEEMQAEGDYFWQHNNTVIKE